MFNAQTNLQTGVASSRRAHLLVYDIPSGKMANPSAMLWRFGARINLSCWVIPDSRVPMLPLDKWAEKGVRAELVRFDERDGDTILRLARTALLEEVGRWREVLDSAQKKVREECDKVTGVGDAQRQQAKKAGSLASFHLQRAKKFAVAAQECALGFDLMGDVALVVDGLREVIKANEELFYGMVKKAHERANPKVEALPLSEEVQS